MPPSPEEKNPPFLAVDRRILPGRLQRAFLSLLRTLLFAVAIALLWCLWALLSLPLLQALENLRGLFIPLPAGSYQFLSGAAPTLPDSLVGLASLPLRDPPLSLLAFGWSVAVTTQISSWFFLDRPGLPKRQRQGKTRAQIRRELLRAKLRLFAIYTLLLALQALPALASHEILAGDELRLRPYFALSDRIRPLDQLRAVRRVTYGRANGLVAWELEFADGDVHTLNGAPVADTLIALLQRRQPDGNVGVEDGKLVLRAAQ